MPAGPRAAARADVRAVGIPAARGGWSDTTGTPDGARACAGAAPPAHGAAG